MSRITKYCFKCKKKIKESEGYNSYRTIDVFGNFIYEIVHNNCIDM
ncbi:hypothetical protein [Spiroplasma endosymbiont of Atherix ibis]